jgi:hypothetical protein
MSDNITFFRGKVVGDNWYIHKNSLDKIDPKIGDQVKKFTYCLPHDVVGKVPVDWIPDIRGYDVVKLHVAREDVLSVSFMYISGWDKHNEPVLKRSISNNPHPHGRGITFREYNGDSAPVYHHKWMMIFPEDAGFDWTASKIRSEIWESNPVIKEMRRDDPRFKSKIGFKGFWRDVCNKAGIGCDY